MTDIAPANSVSSPPARDFFQPVRRVLMSGVCLGLGTVLPVGDRPITPSTEPWYRLGAPWQSVSVDSGSSGAIVPFSDQNNVFGLTDVGIRNRPNFVDLDGDGDMDLMEGASDGRFNYFENTGNSTEAAFGAVQVNPFSLVKLIGFSAPSFADLDNDGDFDLLAGDEYGALQYFENVDPTMGSTPVFSAPQQGPFGLVTSGLLYSSPSFVDIDADGDQDVFVGEVYGSFLFFENTGSVSTPAFIERTGAANPLDGIDTGIFNTPYFTDVDNNGTIDVLTGCFLGDFVYLPNTGDASTPAFAPAQVNAFGLLNPGQYSAPALVDIDSDGDLDLFSGEITGRLIYFKNSGTAGAPSFVFDMPNPLGLADAGLLSAPAMVDVDGDGDLDVYVGEQGPASGVSGKIFFLRNTGTPTSPAFSTLVENPFGLSFVGFKSHPALADFDGDADLDLLVGDSGGTLQYYENVGPNSEGDPVFASRQLNPFGCDLGASVEAAPAFADLDGDNLTDILSGDAAGNLIFLKNTGSVNAPACAVAQTNPFGLTAVPGFSTPSLVDIDLDGDLDAVVGETGGTLLFFENTGSATAPAFLARTGTDNPMAAVDVDARSAPTFADLDGNGTQDSFVGADLGTISFYRNDNVSLPIELDAFTAFADGSDARLAWHTASETDNAGFEIQHREARIWRKVSFVPGAGTSTSGRSYSYRIPDLDPGRHVFRLRQIDFDGTARISPEATVFIAPTVSLDLSTPFPNPFVDRTRFTLVGRESERVRISVFDVAGRQVALLFDGSVIPGHPIPFDFDGRALPNGLYLLAVESDQSSVFRSLMHIR